MMEKIVIKVPLLLFLISIATSMGNINAEEFVWGVDIGDTKKYTYTEFYCDDQYQSLFAFLYSPNNSSIIGKVEKGSNVEIEIRILEDNPTFLHLGRPEGTITYNGNVTFEIVRLQRWIIKVTSNNSAWEELYPDGVIEGDLLVRERSDESTFNPINPEQRGNHTGVLCEKRNLKTGWLEYDYYKLTNQTHLLYETELTAEDFESTLGMEILSLVPLFIVSMFYARKRK